MADERFEKLIEEFREESSVICECPSNLDGPANSPDSVFRTQHDSTCAVRKFAESCREAGVQSHREAVYGPIRIQIVDEWIAAGSPTPKENWLYSRLVESRFANYTTAQAIAKRLRDRATEIGINSDVKTLAISDAVIDELREQASAVEREFGGTK